MKRCLETDTHTQGEHHVKMKEETPQVMLPQAKEHLDFWIGLFLLWHSFTYKYTHTHTHTHTHQFMHLPSHVHMLQIHAHTHTYTHTHTPVRAPSFTCTYDPGTCTHTLKSSLTLSEVLPKIQLLTEVAWFAQLWECSSVTWEGSIPLPSIRINQMVLPQLPAMGTANSHVHFYMAFCMGWEETSMYTSGSYLSSWSEVMICQCFKRKIHGYEVIIWPNP